MVHALPLLYCTVITALYVCVCVCVYVCVCVCVCTHTYKYTYLYILYIIISTLHIDIIFTCTCTCTYTYIYAYLPTAGHPDAPPPRTLARSFVPRLRRRLKRVSACLRTYETHALKEAFGTPVSC